MDRTHCGIADDDAVMDPVRAGREKKIGNQPGHTDSATQASMALIEAENPPTRLYLGPDALSLVGRKLDQMTDETAKWETLSRSTTFAAVTPCRDGGCPWPSS